MSVISEKEEEVDEEEKYAFHLALKNMSTQLELMQECDNYGLLVVLRTHSSERGINILAKYF